MIDETWLEEFIGSGDLAFDIGANVGAWTERLASSYTNVLAVEPDPRAFAILQASANQNVLCQNCVANSKNGAVDFYLRENPLQSSLLEDHPVGAGGMAEAPPQQIAGVNGHTLDFLLFIARQRFGDVKPDFIKIDVEGAEGDVLAGATDPAFRKAKWLIEVHDREVEVGLQLERLGYDEIEIIKHPYPKAHPKHFWIYAT